MKKWNDFQNPVSGRYKLSTMVVSALLVGVLLWQGVFAMLGTTDVNADAFAMMEAFSADVGDGLHKQRQAAWNYAVRNPAAEGGVWGQFWGTAQFGAVGAVSEPTPTPTPLPVPAIPLVGDLFTHNNVVWRVLHRQEGAALIITEHVHGVGTQYNTINTYTRLTQSILRGTLNTWAQDNLGSLRHLALTPIGVDDDVRSVPGAGNWNNEENAAAGRTSPGARMDSDSAVFVLSISELNQYFSPPGVNGNTPENQAARIARDTNGTAHHWWLRSPGSNMASAAIAAAGGYLSATSSTNTSVGFRPALWISI